MSRETPSWFTDASVQRTVDQATDANEPTERIAAQLGATVFEDVPQDRLETLVQSVQSRSVDTAPPTRSQPTSTDTEPGDWPDRYVDSGDIQYLSDREFARVLGLLFEGYEGSIVRPTDDETVVPDLYWNRSHRTLAFRTVTCPSGIEVGVDTIAELLAGESKREGTRAPSEIYVVTNTGFTEAAASKATSGDLTLVARGRLEAWLRLGRLDMDTAGTVLEHGESHDGALTELFEDGTPGEGYQIDPLTTASSSAFILESTRQSVADPASGGSSERGRSGSSPTDRARRFSSPSTDPSGGSTDQDTDNGPLSSAAPPDPGEHGTLYADPDNDGDYEAFDAVLEDLDEHT